MIWCLFDMDKCCGDLWQSAGSSSALFFTAAAQNLLGIKLAEKVGVIIPNTWITWFKVASVPAIVSLLVTPLVLYVIYPPETKDTPDAPALAAKKLESMGPVTKNEWVMVATMLLAVSLWVFGYVIWFSILFLTFFTWLYVIIWSSQTSGLVLILGCL